MSLFEERRKRKAQARANAYIKSLKGKEIKDIEKSFLDNKELQEEFDNDFAYTETSDQIKVEEEISKEEFLEFYEIIK